MKSKFNPELNQIEIELTDEELSQIKEDWFIRETIFIYGKEHQIQVGRDLI